MILSSQDAKQKATYKIIMDENFKYLGSSLIRRIVRTPQPIRDTANNGCERVGGGSSPKLLSVAGLELLALAPDWLRLLVVGAVDGVAVGLLLIAAEKAVQKYIHKQNPRATKRSLVSIQLEELQGQYQGLRGLFEELLIRTSSDISNDAEDMAARFQANTKIINLINETLQIDPEKDFTARIKKKIKLFAAIRDYLDCYWSFIPQEAYLNLRGTGEILRTTIRDAEYVNKLDKKTYRFYQGVVFSYLYKLLEKLKDNDSDGYLFPLSAEEKAVERIKDISDLTQWENLPKSEESLTEEQVEKYMEENGLS